MDETLYQTIIEYGERELIPKFQKECEDRNSIRTCPSYKKVRALCDSLNAIAPYTGHTPVTPGELVGRAHGKK